MKACILEGGGRRHIAPMVELFQIEVWTHHQVQSDSIRGSGQGM